MIVLIVQRIEQHADGRKQREHDVIDRDDCRGNRAGLRGVPAAHREDDPQRIVDGRSDGVGIQLRRVEESQHNERNREDDRLEPVNRALELSGER